MNRKDLRPWIRNRKYLWIPVGLVIIIAAFVCAIIEGVFEGLREFFKFFSDNAKDGFELMTYQVKDK